MHRICRAISARSAALIYLTRRPVNVLYIYNNLASSAACLTGIFRNHGIRVFDPIAGKRGQIIRVGFNRFRCFWHAYLTIDKKQNIGFTKQI